MRRRKYPLPEPGTRFEKLVIVGEAPKRGNNIRHYECRCDCGVVKEMSLYVLSNGVFSCGCYRRPEKAPRKKRNLHPEGELESKRPEYRAWLQMIHRCYNPKSTSYPDYGARGIRVCDAWQTSFAQFLRDVGKKPGKKFSLERENVDGDYEPGNVYWATIRTQSRNKRNSRVFTLGGKTQTLTDWARERGLNISTVWKKVSRGIPIEDALK
jgi:hypothetical protein